MKNKLEKRGWNYAFIPSAVILSPDLSHADVRVYSYLVWRSGTKDNSWPKVETMAKALHMGESSVRLSLKNLVATNWIRRERNFKSSSTTYIYDNPEDCQSANPLAHDPLAGERTDRSPVSRLKESHKKENQQLVDEPEKQPRPRDLMFDAISEVCQADPKTAGGSIAKVKQAILDAQYTPEDVIAFGKWWWGWKDRKAPPTLWVLKERIGVVRSPQVNQQDQTRKRPKIQVLS